MLTVGGGGRIMDKQHAICQAMIKLLEEQQMISRKASEFQFICSLPTYDTIPFTLTGCGLHKQFSVPYKCKKTPYFRLEKVDVNRCCAMLTLLEGVDMDGNRVDSCEELYALRKTKTCITVNLNCFCAITPLPPHLVGKCLPVIEPKL